jgi:hypothetical protein
VSFELHGPVFTIPKTTTNTYNKLRLKIIGKYLWMWGEHLSPYTGAHIYNFAGNLVRSIKSTIDIGRLWTLHILRLGKDTGEHFFGYGDASSPRCRPASGSCGAEFEKCLDDATCTMMCPGSAYNCDRGNFGAPFYDAKTKLLFIDSIINGAPIYKYDPDTGYIDDWLAEAFYPSCYSVAILPYDETYFYLLIGVARYPDKSHLYRCRWDTLRYEWKSTTYLKDACELVASNLVALYHFDTFSAPEQGGWIVNSHDGTTGTVALLKPDGTLTRLPAEGRAARVFATKYMLRRLDNTPDINIYDLETMSKITTLSTPYSNTVEASQATADLPFITLTDNSKYYFYLLKYNGAAPLIQYDPSTRKFRVVDLITGNPVTAKVKAWCSSIGYPTGRFPVAITPAEITVSDWTSPPACDNGVVTLAVSDVVV